MENKGYLKLLLDIIERARIKLLKEGLGTNEILGLNIKGDVTRSFDKTTEDYLMNEIRKIYKNITFLAEEAGVVEEGNDVYIIIDPIDGSSNHSRGIGLSAISVAVAPSPYFEEVEIGIVKDIVSGNTYYAVRGEGSYLNGLKVRPSQIKELQESIVGIDLDFPDKSGLDRVIPILKSVKKVRKIGSNSLELSYVSSGGYEAFLDLRNILSAENFAAAKLIIEEAGGIFTDDRGNSVEGKIDLTKKQNLVAAGNEVLYERILELL
ncbi:MAG: inositol monophosphatase family protein [Candidatus Freyrarchaeum guaymaensis]|nr:inositol monophosphatase family protein [Candidatus Sigynarchaeota archaeon]